MATPLPAPSPIQARPAYLALGAVLIAAGCLGHLLAAQAIGGSRRAYGDHMLGFFGIAIITGAIILVLRRFLWRGPLDVTIVGIGLVQALFGLWVYVERFNIH